MSLKTATTTYFR